MQATKEHKRIYKEFNEAGWKLQTPSHLREGVVEVDQNYSAAIEEVVETNDQLDKAE